MVPVTTFENDLKVVKSMAKQSSKTKRSKETMQVAIAVDFPLKVVSRRITILHDGRALRATDDSRRLPGLLCGCLGLLLLVDRSLVLVFCLFGRLGLGLGLRLC